MIFCFSGTGNSLHAAKRVQEKFGGELVDMAAALRDGKAEYSFEAGEMAVFVFPVYFDALPVPVTDFIRAFRIAEGEPDIVGIATCGGSAGGTDRMFRKQMRRKGLSVRAFYDVKMPDNCIFWLKPPIREAALMTLKHSDDRLSDILDSMQYGYRVPYRSSGPAGVGSVLGGAVSGALLGTSSFSVDDSCVSCGLCARICPSGAIEMREGRPVWTKSRCWKCAGCINRCPQEAIQYGRGSRRKFRYCHPDLREKK